MRKAQKVLVYSTEKKECMGDNIKIDITNCGSDSTETLQAMSTLRNKMNTS